MHIVSKDYFTLSNSLRENMYLFGTFCDINNLSFNSN